MGARSVRQRLVRRDYGGQAGGVAHGRQLDTTNTGPEAAGYALAAYTGSYTISASNVTFTGLRFPDGCYITGDNVTFRGCEFRCTTPDGYVVRPDGQNALFEDCRFRPAATDTTPVSHAASYQQGIKVLNGVGLTVRRCEFWGFGNAIEFEPTSSTQSQPVVVEECWMHDAADQANSVYHHDGILSSTGASWVTVRRCKIASGGNTNAIAFQTQAGGTRWSDITLTDNQFGGFGYTVNLGDDIPSNNVVFTGNEFTRSPVDPLFQPLKNVWGNFTGTRVWSGNVHAAGGYWWPGDTFNATGHATDFAG